MKTIEAKNQAQLEQPGQKNLEWWNRKSIIDKLFYVLLLGIVWGSILLSSKFIVHYFLDGKFPVERLTFDVIYYLIVGLIIGVVCWWYLERQHRKSFGSNLSNSHTK